jgi:signal transduction histidine kinase
MSRGPLPQGRLFLIARIGQLITSDLELEDLLQQAADLTHAELSYPNVDVPLLAADDPGTLVLRVRGGAYKDRIREEARLPVEGGVMGAAVRERRTQIVADVTRDPRYVPPPSGLSMRAELAVPILLGEQVLGVLNVEGPEPFGEEDVTTLETIAGFLAVAIRNAELVARSQELAVMEERHRLARELHDSVTQTLFSAKLIAESVLPAWRRDAAEGEKRVERLAALLAAALGEMRGLLKELRPPEEQRLLALPSGAFPLPAALRVRRDGVAAVLGERVAELARDGLAATIDAATWRRETPEREEALAKIALELVSNAVKHARPRRIAVRLAAGPSGPALEVEDDGAGFDVEATLARAERRSARGGGLGLLALAERVRALGGALRFDSAPGRGTRVRVTLPAVALPPPPTTP